jgi:DNA-binding transcriptional regulator YhcF (GntR family)
MATAGVLNGLTKTNLREQALASLRTAITSGRLAPQTQMVETELSEQLQISRGTLREAMRQLQQEGLLVAAARGRLYVRRLGAKEVVDIFVVRASLEALAASLLAQRDDRDASVNHLRGLLQAMADAVENLDLEGRIESDLAFHRSMCALTETRPCCTRGKVSKGLFGCQSCSPEPSARSGIWMCHVMTRSWTRSAQAIPTERFGPCTITCSGRQPISSVISDQPYGPNSWPHGPKYPKRDESLVLGEAIARQGTFVLMLAVYLWPKCDFSDSGAELI